MSDLIAVVLFEMQELSLLIKADHPISSVELIDDPTKLHELHSRTFIDAQEFKLYRHIVTTFPHLSQDPDLPTANRPSIRVSCFVARGPMYFVWNVFFVLVYILQYYHCVCVGDPDTVLLLIPKLALAFFSENQLDRVEALTQCVKWSHFAVDCLFHYRHLKRNCAKSAI